MDGKLLSLSHKEDEFVNQFLQICRNRFHSLCSSIVYTQISISMEHTPFELSVFGLGSHVMSSHSVPIIIQPAWEPWEYLTLVFFILPDTFIWGKNMQNPRLVK